MTDIEAPVVDDEAPIDEPPSTVGPSSVGHDDELPPTTPDLVDQIARVTGLLLVVLLPIHLVTLFVRDPDSVDASYLIDRWSNPAWLLADWGLLAVGTTHALLSLWARVPAPDHRTARVALWVATASFAVALFVGASWGMLRLH